MFSCCANANNDKTFRREPPRLPQVSFVASVDVEPPPPLPGQLDWPHDPCTWPVALAGGWAAANTSARLYVTDQGRVALVFPGASARGESLGYTPAGASRWC